MFYYIEGIVAVREPGLAVVDCGGVGFALHTTNISLGALKTGEKARMYVHTYVREGAIELYGFISRNERSSFEQLIGVSGVGPKVALAILSSGTPEQIALAIVGGDERLLTTATGVGKKLAQRIILELKDKIGKSMGDMTFAGAPVASAPSGSKLGDAVAALAVLGYSNSEISVVLREVDTESLALEEIIRQALRQMSKIGGNP